MRLALLCALLFACKTPPPNASAVSLMNHNGDSVRVQVELATTPEARELGLMNRDHLDDARGMLFVFPSETQETFWMKNTLIPLDMIFIRADMTILGVVERAEPLTLTGRGPQGNSKYVLEVNGGFAEEHGLAAGDRVKFENVPEVSR